MSKIDLTKCTLKTNSILAQRSAQRDSISPPKGAVDTRLKANKKAKNKKQYSRTAKNKRANNGVFLAFAANSPDKTSSVFLVINGILIVLLIFLFSYIPIMSRLFDTTDAGYVVTNIAAAGGDVVSEIELITGVERAMPVFWENSKTTLCKQNGETITAYIMTSRQSDYAYARSMLSISGGENALKLGKAVVSTYLSKKLGWKKGQLVEVLISGQSIKVEVAAVETSSLFNSFIIIESTGLGIDLPYNNIFLKLNDDYENEALTAIRAKYGLQNILIPPG